MPLPCVRRVALWGFTVVLAAASTGCPQLNRWSGPSQDPFFSVADEPLPQPLAVNDFQKTGGETASEGRSRGD